MAEKSKEPAEVPKRGRGRPKFEPTEVHRRTVEGMAAVGIPQVDIAKIIGIAMSTLQIHFEQELQLGSIKATAKVGEFLFRMATVPVHQATSANIAAAIFWMKARAGWREKLAVETLDENGNPINPGQQTFIMKIER